MTPALLLMQSLLFANPADAVAAHHAEVEDWRERRVARLTEPFGWLSLVGLHWLEDQPQWTLGSAGGNDVQLAVGPPHLGVLRRDAAGTFHLELVEAVDARIGDSEARTSSLSDGRDVPPTFIHVGDARMVLMRRGDRHALRVWDRNSPTRTGFAGIEHFPISYDWRFEAEWEAYETPRAIEIIDVTGAEVAMRNPGRAWFEVEGRRYSLDAVQEEGATQLWFILADRTSGRDTYGGGRFLYAPLPDEAGKVIVDFNRAYNPPCAFTEYSTCPLPPQQNRLDLRIEAGEMRYRGELKTEG